MGTHLNRHDATGSPRRASALPVLVCALLAAASAHAAGVADTVTVLPTVQVDANHVPLGTHATGTEIRLDRAKLARFMPATASDALVSVPGVDLVKTGPWATRVTMRGLSGDRVLVMVDGVRLNTTRGHGAQASLVAVDGLDAVEVAPGAGSAQYGSGALGGVVNFVTHRALIEPVAGQSLVLTVRGSDPGSTWSQRARWRLTGPRFGLELSGGAGAQAFLKTPDSLVANSGSRDQDFAGRFALRLATATLDYEHAQRRGYDIGLPAFGDRAGSRGVYPLQRRDLDRAELVVPDWARFAPETRLLVVGQAFETDFDELVVSRVTRIRLPILEYDSSADRVSTRNWSVQPSLRFPRLGGLRLSGEWRREKTHGPRTTDTRFTTLAGVPFGTATTTLTQTVPPASLTLGSGAVYAAPRFGHDGRLCLEGGARYDAQWAHADSSYSPIDPTHLLPASDRTEHRTSVEGGTSYDFGGWEPYAHVSTGFRAPNLDERYYNGYIHGALYVFGARSLRPERNLSTDLGLRLRGLGPVSNARVSVYRYEVQDLIQITAGSLYQGVMRFSYENVRSARIEGVEGTALLRLGSSTIGLSGTLPRAYERINAVRKGLTTDAGTARASVEMTVPVTNMVPQGLFSVRWRWNDAFQPRVGTLAQPSFHITSAELSTAMGSTRVVFAVNNVFDRSYREPLSYIPEPGRAFSMSVRREFGRLLPIRNSKRTP